MAFSNPSHFVTGKVRLSFVHLSAPYAREPGAQPKYECQILIPKADSATKARMDAALAAAIKRGAEKGYLKGIPADKVKNPIYDGDGYRADGYTPFPKECKGCWVITARSNNQPAVVDSAKNPIINDDEIYSGMYAKVAIDFYAFARNSNKGIAAGLGNVMKVADGERLGAPRASVDDDFADEDDDILG